MGIKRYVLSVLCFSMVVFLGFDNCAAQKKALLITSDFGSVSRCKTVDGIRKVANVMISANPNIMAVDAASPDNCQYDSAIGYLRPNKNLQELRRQGHDPYGVLVSFLKDASITVVSNIRMNDHHGNKEQWSPWAKAHKQWSLGKDTDELTWSAIGALRQMDYSIEGVREHRFGIIKEILERYDVDGIQLDFGRTTPFVSEPKTENAKFMTAYLRDVRSLLKNIQKKRGRKKSMILGVVVPWDIDFCVKEGLDIKSWLAEELIDYICPGEWFYSDWNMPIERWSKLVAGSTCQLYPMCLGEVAPWREGSWLFQRGQMPLLEDNEKLDGPKIRSLAEVAYRQGADGMMFYNFYTFCYGAYYPALRSWVDPEMLTSQTRQYYYCRRLSYTPTEYENFKTGRAFDHWPLDKKGQAVEYKFYFGADLGSNLALLRFKMQDAFVNDAVQVAINGKVVKVLGIDRFDHVTSEEKKMNVTIWQGFVSGEHVKEWQNQLTIKLVNNDSQRTEPIGVDEFEIWVGPVE